MLWIIFLVMVLDARSRQQQVLVVGCITAVSEAADAWCLSTVGRHLMCAAQLQHETAGHMPITGHIAQQAFCVHVCLGYSLAGAPAVLILNCFLPVECCIQQGSARLHSRMFVLLLACMAIRREANGWWVAARLSVICLQSLRMVG
jgi:hypothetical protein